MFVRDSVWNTAEEICSRYAGRKSHKFKFEVGLLGAIEFDYLTVQNLKVMVNISRNVGGHVCSLSYGDEKFEVM